MRFFGNGWRVNGYRREEVLPTLVGEGCTHERAALIEEPDGPVVNYALEVASTERPRAAAESSRHASCSGGETRTLNPAVNSRMLCQLSYPGMP